MKPYIPEELPLTSLDYKSLITLVGRSNAALAEYNGLLQSMINPNIFLSPLTTQEAVISSKIEGTQATMSDVLAHEAGKQTTESKQADIVEILNYRKALLLADTHIQDYPITLNLILELHKTLMDSVRGQNKSPGHFRDDQNWIGPAGSKIEGATFVPPEPLSLKSHLQDLQKYIESDDIDVIVQVALMHAQFELLHPFKDGNGRLGRLLIPIFLCSKKVIVNPVFYMSSYLERNRDQYYESLRDISLKKDWNSWVEFFLMGVCEQAVDNVNKAKSIIALYAQTKIAVTKVLSSQKNLLILDFLFNKPMFRLKDLMLTTSIESKATGHKYVKQLVDNEVVKVFDQGKGRKPTVYVFSDLLNIAEGKNIF